MKTKDTKGKNIKDRIFKEVFNNPPKIVAKTRKKEGDKQADKQQIAIALSKIRSATKK